ncbi:Succinate-semialdehyde dehydrogenase, mitochondrial [Perkinsus olseni]|uniref:Succinate-semialdehyde dehydrogenase, mitochondrial n=1 Tax=Perkinsus olseni TaxID=32597 RepID=A0A7J6MBT1_PEROL|nr:Succinate-semialdehyde dehydrogenase, mitochondrial [Perkinsus olseni]
MSKTYRMLIAGDLIPSTNHFYKYNPANGTLLAKVPVVSAEQIDEAVLAGKKAFEMFSRMTKEERNPLLLACAEAISANSAEMAELLCKEQGKPLSKANKEVQWAVSCFKKAAEVSIPVKVLHEDDAGRVEVRYCPIGVVAAIVPWNFPLAIAACHAAISLAFGNAVIIKPSPQTPVTALRMGEILQSVVPPGLIQVVSGPDTTGDFNVGEYLVKHPGIRKVSFTGSVPTGKRVLANSVADLTRCTLELGGNDPAIVLPDAAVPEVVPRILRAAFMNSGQVCSAVKRIYVHESIYDDFVGVASEEVKKLGSLVGDGMDAKVIYGPINNEMQYNRVRELVADAVKQGGKIVQGQLDKGLSEDGYSEEADVISRANGTPYGLSASVWGTDCEALNRVAGQILAGVVDVNSHGPSGNFEYPFGGFKDSGLGREGDFADADLTAYTEVQTIRVATRGS